MRDEVFVQQVLEKCEALRDAGLWDREPKLRPRAWLKNFDGKDQAVAAAILNQVVYLSSSSVDRTFLGGVRSLQQTMIDPTRSSRDNRNAFEAHLARAVFAPVQGEQPNPTDSGYVFCRRIRNLLGVEEDQITDPEKALQAAESGAPVYLVDDFIGSGDQALKMWSRKYAGRSLADVHARHAFQCGIICAVSTWKGAARIRAAGKLAVFPGHEIDERYTAPRIPELPQLPQLTPIYDAVTDVLKRTTHRLDLSSKPFLAVGDQPALGYHSLGLFLLFEHGAPDATLPILWAPGDNDWAPLYQA